MVWSNSFRVRQAKARLRVGRERLGALNWNRLRLPECLEGPGPANSTFADRIQSAFWQPLPERPAPAGAVTAVRRHTTAAGSKAAGHDSTASEYTTCNFLRQVVGE
jgi:hypothetical protein